LKIKSWHYLLLATFLLIIDQGLKTLSINKILPEMGGFLVDFCNPNLAWSIPINGVFFWIAWIIIVILIIYNLKKSFNAFLLIVLFGAISNIIDRIFRGCVIDYINTPYFPAFNLADVMITGGIILFLIQDIFWKNKNNSK
jgi:lipoprotein signal peptidase